MTDDPGARRVASTRREPDRWPYPRTRVVNVPRRPKRRPDRDGLDEPALRKRQEQQAAVSRLHKIRAQRLAALKAWLKERRR